MRQAAFLGLAVGASCMSDYPSPDELRAVLQPIAEAEAKKYNCSISIAVKNRANTVTVAAGTTDFETGSQMKPDDTIVWGSCTKVLTGSSIMQLASQGKLDLDAPAEQYVDPFLAASAALSGGKQNFTSLQQLFGPNVSQVTVRRLLNMHSGIPDFDTAKPCEYKGCVATDSLRKDLYDNPTHNYSPIELMSLPWVAYNQTIIPPMTFRGTEYSSTNFMILGMILAKSQGWSEWDGLMQADFLPDSVRDKYRHLTFGAHGAPSAFSTVHGYDRTAYNGNKGSRDVFNVAGTFSGWTASDLCGTAADIAELAWDVYGPDYNMAPKKYIDQMIPIWPWYGAATFNLTSRTGREPPLGTAYGHLGATYGYQSILSYHPELELSFAIGSNLETDNQQHPADALCLSFNAVANLYRKENITCKYVAGGYYDGGCKCK